MRLIIDTLIALMLVLLLGGLIYQHREQQNYKEQVQQVHQSLAMLHEQSLYHAAMSQVETSRTGFPMMVDMGWFEEELPYNPLVAPRHPWLDMAPEGDMDNHPPDPVITSRNQAGIWYNPNRGVFRARVPQQMSHEKTLELYNRLNGSSLVSFAEIDDSDSRTPQPLTGSLAEMEAVDAFQGMSIMRRSNTEPRESTATPNRPQEDTMQPLQR